MTDNASIVRLDHHDDGLVVLTLNNPARRNALSRALVDTFRASLEAIAADPQARVLVITGAGDKAFCAGADLKERAQMKPAEVSAFVTSLRRLMDEVADLPKPTIAAINGFALGGGCELALACDLRVMSSEASIGLPETHLGIIPGAGGTQRLPRLIGPALAKELIFTGRRVKADEAQRLGLINRTAGPGEGALLEVCRELASPILRAAPIALKQAKRAVNAGLEVALPTAMLIEQACYDVTIPTEDRLEALAAFREKRSPNFKGR